MKITAIDIAIVDVPFIAPVRNYKGSGAQPTVIVQARTDAGLVGLGELWTPPGWLANKQQVELAAQTFIGQDPLALPLQTLSWPRQWEYPGIPGLYTHLFQPALYDLAGQALGVPVWRLIGDQHRDRVPVAYWSCHMPPEETAREAEQAVARGFRVHKLKARSWDIVRQAELISKVAGPDYAIRPDPNTEFRDVATAVRLARQLAPYNIECFEDPVLKHDVGWYRLLRQKIDIPQALHLHDPQDVLRAVSAEAVDCFNVGYNVDQVLPCHAIAAAAGIPVWHAIAGLSLGIRAAFAVHVGCTLRNATMPSDELPFLRENDLVGGALSVEDGHLRVPAGPGLGVQLDEAALRHYRID